MGASVGRWPPAARISSSSSSRAPWVRAVAITWAPAAARALAQARPMPRLAPVTSAMRPERGRASVMNAMALRACLGLRADQERQLSAHHVVARLGQLAVQQARGIVASEVMVGELGMLGVARSDAHGPIQAFHRQEA